MASRNVIALISALLLMSIPLLAASQSVTRSTFREIEKVQELTTEERFDEAIAVLEELVANTKGTPYDYAVANQYLAHNSVMTDNIPRAREALEAAINTPGLPPEMLTELKLFYGSVLLGEEEFEVATQMLEDWLASAEQPLSRQIFTVGYANYMTGNLPRAEELLAIAVEKGGATTPHSWYQVYYRILFDARKYEQGEQLMYELLEKDPSVALHWRMLASHYLQLEESRDGLATMMLSYLSGQIEDSGDLLQIVSLYGFIDAPEKAARMLAEFIEDGKIEADAEVTKQLGTLWLLARERANAKTVLEEAAGASPDGSTYAMLGGIYFDDEEWPAAYKAYQQALKLGGLKEPDRVTMLAGISAFYADMMEEARSSLEDAAKSDEYRQQAESLLKKIDEA